METQTEKLTPKQIENWRKMLLVQLGPYALIMPDEEIQKIRNTIQEKYGE